jgi:multidrug resistance efflux pump
VVANLIRIPPRVSGPLVQLPIRDNQFVRKGDLLFEIDPRTFQAALDRPHADLETAKVEVQNARKDERRFREAAAAGSAAVSQIDLRGAGHFRSPAEVFNESVALTG